MSEELPQWLDWTKDCTGQQQHGSLALMQWLFDFRARLVYLLFLFWRSGMHSRQARHGKDEGSADFHVQ